MQTENTPKDILRIITAGSVDDGKSTLIGRLLYDSKNILSDQLEAIEKSSKNKKNGSIDLALLTDGLRSEREQGITIDVAYRYFATDKRKFIVADVPGHIQYTRNMITGASNVSLAILLIDARQGVAEQSRRHSIIASLLGIPHIVIAINKMDLVGYSEDVYNNILIEYNKVAEKLGLKDVRYYPISALEGDNIVTASEHMPWYDGGSLLDYLETVDLADDINYSTNRFQVQLVIRPQTPELHDYRGYAGKITSGKYKKGDAVKVLPAGIESTIDKIEIAGQEVEEAQAPQNVTILLSDKIDISRGDTLVKVADTIQPSTEAEAIICWMDEKPFSKGNKYILQHNHKRVRISVKDILYKLDVNTLQQEPVDGALQLNEIARIAIKAASPLVIDSFKDLQSNGSAILIDETSNNTVAAVLFQ